CRPVLHDHTHEDKGPLSPEVTSRLPPLDASPEEARQLGYMPHRDDYEREYDMSAEELVSSLQLNNKSEDTEIETALKLAQVDMYIRRLRERYRRKRAVRDYQLVAKFFANHRKDLKKPLTKEQRELRDNMRVFSQFLTAGEHERLINSIERERELRLRLSELLRYRSLGLTTQDEIIHYEQHVAYQRQQQLRQNKAAKLNRKSVVNKHRLYQFTFNLGQQWLCNINTGTSIKKRKKRRRPKFHRRKVHVASRRRIREQQQLSQQQLG
ncbi:hypothetical protein AMK59_905, partial [Oryctes borbonicus]